MVYSDTSNKLGIIQRIEKYCELGDGGISGDSTLLKIITADVNEAFDELMPRLLSWGDTLRFDDPAHGGNPVYQTNIVSGSGAYITAEDSNNNDILNITNVRILPSATATEYVDLIRMTLDDSRVPDVIAPNPSTSGVPTHFLEKGNTTYLYPEPNYSATDGLQLFFEREQSYFASSDTTKEPGIPKPFHRLLPLYVSRDWLAVNKPAQTTLMQVVLAKINRAEQEIDTMIGRRNPTRQRLSANVESTR